MDYRIDRVEIPHLKRFKRDSDWLQLRRVLGHGSARLLDVDLNVPAFAWRSQDVEPALQPGPWHIQIALENGMLVQPMVDRPERRRLCPCWRERLRLDRGQ